MKIIVILFIIFFFVSAAGQTHKKPKTNYDPVEITIREIKSKISYNLELLEREYLTKLSYRDYIRAKDLLIDSYKMLMAIPDEDEFTYDEPFAISDSEFSALISGIKNESFESDMLSVV